MFITSINPTNWLLIVSVNIQLEKIISQATVHLCINYHYKSMLLIYVNSFSSLYEKVSSKDLRIYLRGFSATPARYYATGASWCNCDFSDPIFVEGNLQIRRHLNNRLQINAVFASANEVERAPRVGLSLLRNFAQRRYAKEFEGRSFEIRDSP